MPYEVPLPGGSQPDSSQPALSRSSSRTVRLTGRRRRPWVVAFVLVLAVAPVLLAVGLVLSKAETPLPTSCCMPRPAIAAELARAHWSVLPPSPLPPQTMRRHSRSVQP